MIAHDLNEPAFPIEGAVANYQFGGMSLRDYFAAKAMQGFIAAFAAEWSHGEITRAAYAQADSMLAERAK